MKKILRQLMTNKITAVLFLVSFAILISLSSASAASTVYVNVTGGDDANDGSIEHPYKTIGKGIYATDENGTVKIANGVYSGENNTNITISKSITITGQSQKRTIINGTGANWIFFIDSDIKVTIQNLTMINGTTEYDGGVITNYGNLTVKYCTFTGNTATGPYSGGGAIYNGYGTCALSGCTFTGNSAAYCGGAICNNGGTLNLKDSTFTGSNAYNGGAIYNMGAATNLTANNCTFTGNTADYGGAIYNEGGFLNLNKCTLVNNSANDGGAIYNNGPSNQNSWTVSSSTFRGNTATIKGGAIHNMGDALNLDNCTFTGNTATTGGGAIWSLIGALTVSHCIFTGNNATYGSGGAIHNGDTCNITGSTLTDNTAIKGGAIYNGYNLTANFNRIVGNKASQGSAIYNEWSDANVKYNWWGSNNPDFSSLIKNVQLGSTNAEPWLKLSIKPNPNEILNTKTSNVTADLYSDSNGGNHSSEYAKYPSEIPLTFTTTWGSITQEVLNYGTCKVVFTANGGPIPQQNPVIVSVADVLNQTATVSTTIKIKPVADLYIYTTSSKTNPKAGETFALTYKLGNNGPDAAENVTMTIKLPEGFEKFEITGDGKWTYDPSTRTITWTLTNVPVGDPYLYVTGKFTKAGNYVFNSAISSETYNLNTDGVTPITIKSTSQNSTNINNTTSTITKVNAAKTIEMQETGLPLNYLILAIIMVVNGLVPKRK